MKKIIHILPVLALTAAIFFNTQVFAVKHLVTVGNFFFNPSTLNVIVGDTIRWQWSAGGHTTTSTPGAIPAGALSWDAPINNTHTFFEYKVTVAGTYAYVCTFHAPGMAGSFSATAFTPTLSVAPLNRNVAASSGTTTYAITSNTTWTASSNETWCTVDPNGSGNANFTASFSTNTTNVVRVATITVTVSGLTPQTVTLTQTASTVGVNEHQMNALLVYPNPTRGSFKVDARNLKEQVLEITVLDISGQEISSRICSGADEYSFDISKHPKGFYFIRINSENTTLVRRIILTD